MTDFRTKSARAIWVGMKISTLALVFLATNSEATEILFKITYPDQEVKTFTAPIGGAEETRLPLKLKQWTCGFKAAADEKSVLNLAAVLICRNKSGLLSFRVMCISPYAIEPEIADRMKWRYETFQREQIFLYDSSSHAPTKIDTSCTF